MSAYAAVSASGLFVTDNSGTVNGVGVSVEFDSGFTFFGALGYRFGNGMRLEGELAYGHISGGDIVISGVLINVNTDMALWSFTAAGYYDFEIDNRFAPYIGGGGGVVIDVGQTTLTANGLTVLLGGDTETYLTAFGEGGLSIRVSTNVELVPAYRYTWIDSGGSIFEDDTSHMVKIGLRFKF